MDTQLNALPTLPVLARTSSDAGLRRPVRVTALRLADVFAFEPGPASRKHGPTPERCPRQEPLGRNGPTAFTLCHRANGLFRARFALPREWIQAREVEMTVQCHDRANCAGVYRCQNRTYDEKKVNDRLSRLFSAQQEALQRSLGWNWLFRLTVAEFGCRDAGRSMKCHPLEGIRRSLTPSFALRSGSTARTVGYSPGLCPRPPHNARSTTSAISGD